MSIYADLLEFKRGILGRVKRDLSNLLPLAQKAAAADLEIIEAQMRGYEARLDLWYRRLWDLHGLWLDPAGRMVRHKGREAALTKREFQLLQFLLDHPYRYYTAQQILNQAWVEPALFPEEVRNYVRRLRTILRDLEIPVDLVNKPARGYSLVFRAECGSAPSLSEETVRAGLFAFGDHACFRCAVGRGVRSLAWPARRAARALEGVQVIGKNCPNRTHLDSVQPLPQEQSAHVSLRCV